MHEEFVIRPAVASDVLGIERVARHTWNSTYSGIIPDEVQERLLDSYYSPTALRESISQERSRFFVATSQGSIIGYAQFYQREGEDRIAELLRIYVLPEWQRAGIGGLLLSEGLSYIAQRGARRLLVNVEKNNLIGRGFYEKQGFLQVKEFNLELAGHNLAMVEYQLDTTKPAG